MDIIGNTIGWEFMNEPMWRWFIFFGGLIAIGVAWHGILDFMHI